jgi:hypothetical protein
LWYFLRKSSFGLPWTARKVADAAHFPLWIAPWLTSKCCCGPMQYIRRGLSRLHLSDHRVGCREATRRDLRRIWDAIVACAAAEFCFFGAERPAGAMVRGRMR